MIFGKAEVDYFCAEGWTGEIKLKCLEKFAVLTRKIFRPLTRLMGRAGSKVFNVVCQVKEGRQNKSRR